MPGWNWIGYLPEKALAVKDALYFMQAVPGDEIRSQNQSAVYNNNGEWLGTLRELQPGQGYLLYTKAHTDLVYPDLKKVPAAAISNPGRPDWVAEVRRYESNMTLIGALAFNGADYGDTSLIVAAFKDGQCRGVAQPGFVPQLNRPVLFLMIHGDPAEEGDQFTLQVYEPETGITRNIEDSLRFNSDAHRGSLQEPLILSVLETDAERIPAAYYLKQNYPNPFNPLTTIEYGLPVDTDVAVTIFNVLGQKVTVLVDQPQRAGRYKLQFDAARAGMASGIYFYQIRTAGLVKSYKMLLLK
jgi:hypothetical protein